MYSNLNLKIRKRILGIIFNRKNYFAILIFSIIGSLMIILSISKYGPGLTHASVNYYSAAESLVNNYQLRQFDNRIFHEYAPLYSILIGLLILIGFDPITSAGIINVICFSSIIFVGSYYLMQMEIGLKYLILGGVLLIFSKPIFQVSKYAWDTSLFIFLSIIIFIEIINYFQNGRKLHLFYCALISSLATLSNFDGITLIIFCSIIILLNKKIIIIRRVIDLSCYMIISIFPLILYLMRNFHLTGTLIGKKGVPSHGINDILNGFFLTIGNWFIPGIIPQILIIAIAIIIIILLTIIFVYCFKISNINSNIRFPVLFSYLFFIIFSIYIIISSVMSTLNCRVKP